MMSTHVALTVPISQPFNSGVHLTTTFFLSAPRVCTTIPSRKPPATTPSMRDTWVQDSFGNYVPVTSDNSPSISGIIWCRIILLSFLPLTTDENWQHHSPGIGQDGDRTMLTSLESRSISDHMVTTVSRFMPDGIGQGLRPMPDHLAAAKRSLPGENTGHSMTSMSPGNSPVTGPWHRSPGTGPVRGTGHRSPGPVWSLITGPWYRSGHRSILPVTGQYYWSPVNTTGHRVRSSIKKRHPYSS
ncbi:hypothetical protein DPMN_029001 [Dreissena polymorpha]|uniref:Uncharacterized protein n=1 Tax=Dreissena polymorpha TaxID=45954 RepID=A0A9D4LYB7_DREPO|nr:hypothetical protein DPMN_029001 [Dreissena polymorpha]